MGNSPSENLIPPFTAGMSGTVSAPSRNSTTSSSGMTAPTAFKFNFHEQPYTKEYVENLLYNTGPLGADVPEHSVQLKSAGRAMCLLCNTNLMIPLTEVGVKRHLESKNHRSKCNVLAKEFYHKVFSEWNDDQIIQMYFKPYSLVGLRCEVCDEVVLECEVYSHANLADHRPWTKKDLDFWPLENVPFEPANMYFDHDAHNRIDYTELKDDDLSLEALRSVANRPNPYTFTEHFTTNICLLCKTSDQLPIERHVMTKKHLKMVCDEVSLEMVRRFHLFWKGQKEKVQTYRTWFIPVNFRAVKCSLCRFSVSYKGILQHVTSIPKHYYYITNEDSTEADYGLKHFIKMNCNFPLNYEDNIQKIFYPESLMREAMKLDSFPCYTVQCYLKNTQCLLCHEFLEGVNDTPLILDHLKSDFHGKKAEDRNNILALVTYHHFWLKQPPNVQAKQHKFRPHNKRSMTCLNCNQILEEKKVLAHLNVPCTTNQIISRAGKVKPSRTLKKIKKPNVQKSKGKSGPPCEAQTTDDGQADTADAGQSANTPGPSAAKIEYDSETISKIYPNYNTTKQQRRPSMYFLQKRSHRERFCLCCLKSIVGMPTEHLNGKNHQRNFDDPGIVKIIGVYHDYWASEPLNFQLAQINFTPWTMDTTKCQLCRGVMPYNLVKNHPCLLIAMKSEQIESFISEEFQKVDIKYDEITWKKFYSKSFMEVSRTLLKTNMPVGHHWLGKIYCFLCPSKIVRDLGLWNQHLVRHCIDDECITESKLRIILKYHRFWETQPVEHQVLQIHFVPKSADKVQCLNRHTLMYSEVIQHTKLCRIQELDKLLKAVERLKLESRANSEETGFKVQVEDGDDDVVIDNDRSSDCDSVASHNSTESVENCSPNKEVMDNKPTQTKLQKTKFGKDLVNGLSEKAHEIISSVAKGFNKDVLQMMPNRLKIHQKYLLPFDDKIKCSACNVIMNNNLDDLLNHVTFRDHMKSANLMPPKYTYICEICQMKMHNEEKWFNHKSSGKHKATYSALGDFRRGIVEEFECLTCLFVIYGDQLSLLRHQELFSIKKEKKNSSNITLRMEVKRLFESPVTAQTISDDLLKKSTEALENNETVRDCLAALEVAIGKQYPGCKAYPFGSRVTGIGKVESDLDVFMDLGNMYDGLINQDSKHQQDIVLKVRKILVEDKSNFSDVLPITSARTPIVRVIHIGTDIDCDLSFRHGLSVENTKFISFCLDLQPITRPAMLLLKHWADMVSLKDEITSYALCMMFIFNLQLQGYLLPVQRLRELTTPDVHKIDGWETVNYSRPIDELKTEVKDYKGNVFEMIKDFFSMYAQFNFDIELICPLLGRTILVNRFSNLGTTLPDEMKIYKERILTDPDCQFRQNSAMCVQDPFDLGHNLTKAVQRPFRKKFIGLCQITRDFMNARI